MIIKCKMCGGDIELSADKTFGTCEYCGSTMTLPKIDSEQRAAAFNRGNHFRRIGEFDKALAVYERIVAENDTDAEAHWCCVLCRFGIEYVEDPISYEYIPTCHRASFDSVLEDVDYLAALEYSDGITRRQYQKDAAKIAEVQRGILATSQNAEPYDVFISYKELDSEGKRTRDSILAQDIYYQLTEKGWRVFFSRISLEDVPGTQYEPYIFAALNSAKVMVVVGTDADNLNAVWVKNEWSRYLSLMRHDRSKLLIPCYRDMDPYDLPEQLSALMSYDMGKIGFIQDLIRGVDKVLAAEKPKKVERETVKETVVVQQSAGGPNVTALLKRGEMALQDGKWDDAKGYFDRVLDMDAECAEAYLGMFLMEHKCADTKEFVKKRLNGFQECKVEVLEACSEATERIKNAADKYAINQYLEKNEIISVFAFNRQYSSGLKHRSAQLEEEYVYLNISKNLNRAEEYASGETLTKIQGMGEEILAHIQRLVNEAKAKDEENINRIKAAYAQHLDKAEAEAKCLREEAESRREAEYQSACKAAENAKSADELNKAAAVFMLKRLVGYKDSAERAKNLKAEVERLAEEAERKRLAEEAERKRLAEEAERKRLADEEARRKAEEAEKKRLAAKKKKTTIILSFLALLAVAAVLIVTMVIIPGNEYKAAEELLAAEKYDEAIAAFKALKDFKDSPERVDEAIEARNSRDYAAAEELLAAEKYDEAIVAFEALGEYKDSADRALEAAYIKAEELLAAGRNAEAAMVYGSIGGYKDAQNRSRELWNNLGKAGLFDTISGGGLHTTALTTNGTVVVTEYKGNLPYSGEHCNVSHWADIVSISGGLDDTVGLKSDGTVVAVGNNGWGRCDVGDWTNIVAISANYHTLGLRSDGTVVATGNYDDGQCDVSDWTDIVAVSAGKNHSVGLKSNGTVVAVGSNVDGQCKVNDWTDIVAVSAGSYHTVGLKSDGTVVAVGDNDDGQCDVSDWRDIVAISAAYHTVGLKADGTVVAVGYDDGRCDVRGWSDIVAVSAGRGHTVGLKSDGSVVAVGRNHNGECDVGNWTDIRVPEV